MSKVLDAILEGFLEMHSGICPLKPCCYMIILLQDICSASHDEADCMFDVCPMDD